MIMVRKNTIFTISAAWIPFIGETLPILDTLQKIKFFAG